MQLSISFDVPAVPFGPPLIGAPRARHPGYLAMLIAIPASAIVIGSWLALIPSAGFCAVIVRRARIEDEFLERNLRGYTDYMQRVRGSLFRRSYMRKTDCGTLCWGR